MKIHETSRAGVTILAPRGKLLIPEEVKLRRAVLDALAGNERALLINLQGVSKIDSAGFSELVAAHASARTRGMKLGLCSLRSNMLDLIHLTHLHVVFDIFGDEDEGIAFFEAEGSRLAC